MRATAPRLGGGVILEVSLSDVGLLLGAIDQNPIPGLVFGRAGAGHLLVPFFAAAEYRSNWADS